MNGMNLLLTGLAVTLLVVLIVWLVGAV